MFSWVSRLSKATSAIGDGFSRPSVSKYAFNDTVKQFAAQQNYRGLINIMVTHMGHAPVAEADRGWSASAGPCVVPVGVAPGGAIARGMHGCRDEIAAQPKLYDAMLDVVNE
jgi:hypothetical protein